MHSKLVAIDGHRIFYHLISYAETFSNTNFSNSETIDCITTLD